MRTMLISNPRRFIKNKKELEEKLNVKINLVGKNLTFEGGAFEEFNALNVFDAIDFGFSAKKALNLKDSEVMFKKIKIGDYTKRNLREIKSRIIGTHGKTKKTMSEISGCGIIIQKNEVGIIGDTEVIDDAETAVINLIHGSKQSNMYRYLERRNRERKSFNK